MGCPDPTADNYSVFADPDNCLPYMGPNGNVLSCTDCLGNPPSSLYGDPLYPSAILPGTMGNQTCCEFTTVDDVVAGCTDPSAINYNENCQGVDVSAANNGQGALIDDGCCNYQQTWTVYCCDVGSWSGVPPLCCIDITVNTQVTYQSLIDSGDCLTICPRVMGKILRIRVGHSVDNGDQLQLLLGQPQWEMVVVNKIKKK